MQFASAMHSASALHLHLPCICVFRRVLLRPPLLFLAHPGPPKSMSGLQIPLGPAKSRPRALFFGPGGLQERSKSEKEAFGGQHAPNMKSEESTVKYRSGGLLGSLLGPFWRLRWLKPVLKFFLERPRADQEHIFGSGGFQERSTSSSRGLQQPSRS